MQSPRHDVTKVGRGLAVELAMEPGGVLAEVSGQVSDDLPIGSEFLQDGQRGPVLEDRPGSVGALERARASPDGAVDTTEMAGIRADPGGREPGLSHPSKMPPQTGVFNGSRGCVRVPIAAVPAP